ncbi:F0F1 ATP synthase subunit delta [Helicobacter burdigaliensis]|uniref:F0F1 ATP synthase subunit delta n=1 Tax=Helicobacter burdigaliensis TaxID=2315334 RepID=UPI000EF6D6FD|nr:F0F1 ATP synthase subunit delta [Helicobacter burdigaliensis]
MKELIAKRYIKAYAKGASLEEMQALQKMLLLLGAAFEIAKFREILTAPSLSVQEKEKFILEKVLDNKIDSKQANFIKILAEYGRLEILPQLCAEVASYIAMLNKEYIATLITPSAYEASMLKEFEEKFGKKLGVKLALEQRVVENAGIKLVVEDLGVEISFSKEKLVQDLKNHILKAF